MFLKFGWIDEFRGLFLFHVQTGFLHSAGFIDIGFVDRCFLDDLSDSDEANPATRVRILRLPNRNPGGVLSQGALEKQNRTVIVKCVQQKDNLFLKHRTRNAPVQFLDKPAVESDRSQSLQFLPPLFSILKTKNIIKHHDFSWLIF